MKYKMNLSLLPYLAIKSKRKTVEMRLFDERRKPLKVGDIIEFCCDEEKLPLICTIENIKTFNNFEELYSSYSKAELGYSEDETPSPDDMLCYYKREDIKKYGTVAITIKLEN